MTRGLSEAFAAARSHLLGLVARRHELEREDEEIVGLEIWNRAVLHNPDIEDIQARRGRGGSGRADARERAAVGHEDGELMGRNVFHVLRVQSCRLASVSMAFELLQALRAFASMHSVCSLLYQHVAHVCIVTQRSGVRSHTRTAFLSTAPRRGSRFMPKNIVRSCCLACFVVVCFPCCVVVCFYGRGAENL